MGNEQKITEVWDIAALEAQKAKVIDMMKQTVSEMEKANAVKISFSGDAKSIGEATKITSEYNKQYEKTIQLTGQLNNLKSTEGQIEEKIQQAQKESIKNQKLQAQATNDQAGAYAKLKAQAEIATKKARDLAAQYGIESKQAKEAAKTANELNTKLKAVDATMNIHNKNVGNYSGGMAGLIEKFKGLAIVGGIVTGVIGAANVAWGVYKKAVSTSDAAMDEFTFTMKGMETATKAFFKTILNGDWSNLLDNMAEAYKRGHDYAETLDLIKNQTRAVNAVHALESKQISELEEKMKNKSLSDSERLQAAKDLAAIQKDYYDKQIQLAQKTLDAELKMTKVTQQQIEDYVKLDESNLNLRYEAEEYNKVLKKKNELERQYAEYVKGSNQVTSRGTVIQRENPAAQLKQAKMELGKFSEEAIKFGTLINDIESKSQERGDKLINALKQRGEANSAYYNENKRIVNQTHTLEASIAADNKKAYEDWKKQQEEKRKIELAYFNDLKMKSKPVSYLTDEIKKQVEVYMDLFNKIEWAKRNNFEIPIEEYDVELIKATGKSVEDLKNEFEGLFGVIDAQGESFAEWWGGITDPEKAEFVVDLVSKMTGAVSDFAEISDNKGKQEVEAFKVQQDEKLRVLNERLRLGLISEEQYMADKSDLELEFEAKKKEIEKREFERKKKLAYAEAVINGASAAISALTEKTLAMKVIALAFVALTLAAQLSKISSSSPGYAKGRKDGPGEWAKVGEQGWEYRGDNTGFFKTPNTTTLTYLKPHEWVMPHNESVQLEKILGTPQVNQIANKQQPQQNNDILNELKRLNKKPTAIVNMDKHGIRAGIIAGNSFINYVNNNLTMKR